MSLVCIHQRVHSRATARTGALCTSFLRSSQCRRMIPNELLDGDARIHSNLDTFALRREGQHRLLSRHGAFTRDRSQVPYAKVLTKCACTKSDQIRSRGVGRNIREASRFKSTRVENFARGKAKIDLFARYHMIPHELLDGNARIDSNPDTVHAR